MGGRREGSTAPAGMHCAGSTLQQNRGRRWGTSWAQHLAAPHLAQGSHSSTMQHSQSSAPPAAALLEEMGQRGPKGSVTSLPGWRGTVHPLPLTPPPGFVPSCCHSTFCFPLKQGHSNDARRDLRRQEYLGTLPARSSLPARPPAVRTFTGSGVYSTY